MSTLTACLGLQESRGERRGQKWVLTASEASHRGETRPLPWSAPGARRG